jgi:hypothetical protein
MQVIVSARSHLVDLSTDEVEKFKSIKCVKMSVFGARS